MISAVIIAKNEEKNIERCLKSVSWCDEVVLIDDNSKDKTVAFAKKFKAKVIEHALENDFAAQRNFGLTQAKHEWVLFVDADEIISDALAYEIQEAVKKDYYGFFVPREDFLWGKHLKHGDARVYLLRLGKKTKGVWEGEVHETWGITGNIGRLKNPIYHYPHQSIAEFLHEINVYTTVRAQDLYKHGIRANYFSIFFYTKIKFIQIFFLKQGFRDGLAGFIHALIMGFHSFLVRAKLWQLGLRKHV